MKNLNDLTTSQMPGLYNLTFEYCGTSQEFDVAVSASFIRNHKQFIVVAAGKDTDVHFVFVYNDEAKRFELIKRYDAAYDVVFSWIDTSLW